MNRHHHQGKVHSSAEEHFYFPWERAMSKTADSSTEEEEEEEEEEESYATATRPMPPIKPPPYLKRTEIPRQHRRAGRRPRREDEDPFFAAYMACTKSRFDEEEEEAKKSKGKKRSPRKAGGAGLGFGFGFGLGFSSCKSSSMCIREDALVTFLPRLPSP